MQRKNTQGRIAGFTVRLSLFALCWTLTHRYNKVNRHGPEGGIYIRASRPIRPTLRCFKSFAQSALVQPSQAQCSVFYFFLCTAKVLSAPSDVLKKQHSEGRLQQSLQKEGILTPRSDMSVQALTLLPAVSVWINNSLLCPLPVHKRTHDLPQAAGNVRMQLPAVSPQSYTTVLRDSAGMEPGAWPSVGVSGPTRRVLLSMESSLS